MCFKWLRFLLLPSQNSLYFLLFLNVFRWIRKFYDGFRICNYHLMQPQLCEVSFLFLQDSAVLSRSSLFIMLPPILFPSNYPYLSLFKFCCQLAEAIYEYGQGNEKQALEILGPDFDAYNCKVPLSTINLFVGNSVALSNIW